MKIKIKMRDHLKLFKWNAMKTGKLDENFTNVSVLLARRLVTRQPEVDSIVHVVRLKLKY